jgi:ABC-type dipeptide/oligopeptide/nickel transport system permease component
MGYINNVLFVLFTMAEVYNVIYQILYSEESAPLHNPFLWRYSSYIYIDTPSPGDPTYVLAGEVNDERFIRSVREKFGLDKPLYEQLLIYLWNVLRSDLGYSYLRSELKVSLVMIRIPATFLLVFSAMAIASAIGIFLGVLAASRGGAVDTSISIVYSGDIYTIFLAWPDHVNSFCSISGGSSPQAGLCLLEVAMRAYHTTYILNCV